MSKVGPALPFSVLLSAACATTPHYDLASAEPAADPVAAHSAATPAAAEPATNASSPAAQQDVLGQEKQRQELDKQKSVLLVERHLATAKSMMAELRYAEAENELLAALELDGANLEAKRLLNDVTALSGKSTTGATVQDMQERQVVRVAQMQAAARDALESGRKYLARGDYEQAIAELSIAKNHVRWAPYSIDWGGMDKEIEQLLDKATSNRLAAEQAARDAARSETVEALRTQEQAERARRDAILDNMISQAIDAFDKAEYDDAIDFCDQALNLDPRNERATEVRDAAFRIGRERVRNDYIVAKREQFKRWHEQMDAARIPETSIYTLPDQDFWAEISERRANRRGLATDSSLTESDRELRAQLSSTRIPGLKVSDEESLSKVIDILRTFTGLPLVVDPAAETAAGDAGVVFQFDFTSSLAVDQVLNIVTAAAGEDVTWTVRHDAVMVTTKAKARAKPTIHNHDVQDLVFGLTDFLGPRIDRLRLLDDMEDDDGGGPFGGIGEKPQLIEISALSTLIQENVAVGTWEEEGVSIAEGEGFIVIVHTPEVQEKVKKFLNDLRRFQSSLVTIESKFMTVASNWIQEVGVDFRGLDNPIAPFKDLDDVTNGLDDNASRGLDNGGLGAASGVPSSGLFYDDGGDGQIGVRSENYFGNPLGSALSTIGGVTTQLTFLNDLQVSMILRAVEKNVDYQLVNSQVISVHNTQRAYVAVINQQAYIQDFDVEVAQFEKVADPQINVLHEGVVLDVRPTIHHNRKYLTLEIQPTVAKVVALRPFSTTLGGNTLPVEFELPELEVQSVFTSAIIPDGGSILLGGLSNIRNIERRAEVPWLAKLPIIGILLKQEGYNDENKTLMILIRAHITDVREEIGKLESRLR